MNQPSPTARFRPSGGPFWEQEGRHWPNREASRFVRAAGITWHVQVMGSGPVLLLLHGTGAATHSWRDLAPLLARKFKVVAPDLPGHGFTELPSADLLSLPGMARALQQLLGTLGVTPEVAAGHSAGAAILVRMSLDGSITPQVLIGLNGALLPFREGPPQIFSPIAKLLASLPFIPHLFAWRAANHNVVEDLIRNTGSTIDGFGLELYGRLVRNPRHVAGALGMMANWDLRTLASELPRLRPPLILVTGSRDRTIPPSDALRVRGVLPSATPTTLNDRPGPVQVRETV